MINTRKSAKLYTKSNLPASDYVINPYIGCTHRCRYCYASFMNRFTGHSEPWGTYIDCKEYESFSLPRNAAGKTILIGSVTDAYNPVEKQFRQMQRILPALAGCEANIEILTKSDLILRDIDLLRQIPHLRIGISLGCPDNKFIRQIEPGAPTWERRIDALKILKDAGFHTYLFVAPIFPGITDLPSLIELGSFAAEEICFENLNLRGAYKQDILDFIATEHPQLVPLYDEIYRKGNNHYWEQLEEELRQLMRGCSIPYTSYFYHDRIRKNAKTQKEGI